ncbi:MAG: glycosyltransferase family 4 protein [Gammaproteobacteria bacterium]
MTVARRQLAFVLFRYFPFGGLQRDCLRLAEACARAGHRVELHTLSWQGPRPPGITVHEHAVPGWTHHGRARRFAERVARDLGARRARGEIDRVIGFNKLPGLDIYYAADPCFAARADLRGRRWLPRYRTYLALEAAVFGATGASRILTLTAEQADRYRSVYGTPVNRFQHVPLPIGPERQRPPDADAVRAAFRGALGVSDEHCVLLALGSGFRTKGLDRSLRALGALAPETRARVRLRVVGADRPGPYQRLARRLGVADRVTFCGGRSDVPRYLLGADLLLHPARVESGGIVLLEAMLAGLPVIASGACGFAPIVAGADAGCVLPEPFQQSMFDQTLARAVADRGARTAWSTGGLAFARRVDPSTDLDRLVALVTADAP